jgi:hypothetical protein
MCSYIKILYNNIFLRSAHIIEYIKYVIFNDSFLGIVVARVTEPKDKIMLCPLLVATYHCHYLRVYRNA